LNSLNSLLFYKLRTSVVSVTWMSDNTLLCTMNHISGYW